MKINTSTDNGKKKLEETINEVQMRSRVRCITVDNILRAIEIVENKLGIAKSRMDNIRFNCDWNAQKFPSAYKGIPESTHFTAENHNGKWFITDIYRDKTKNECRRFELTITEDAREAVLEKIDHFWY